VWSDDFHHAVHTLLTGERQGYYQDFGKREQLTRALNEGFVFQGEHSNFWGKPRGAPVGDMPLPAHVICLQNHDQVGNRAKGERLTVLAPRGARKLASALLLLAPHTPLLFMGQEYDEAAPFQFFTDFTDPQLQKAVREGRRKEFKQFTWDEVPDPQDPATFERSRLSLPGDDAQLPPAQGEMLRWYQALIALRKRAVTPGERTCRAEWRDGGLVMQAPARGPRVLVHAAFPGAARFEPGGGWKRVLASDEDGYGVAVYVRG
jgi:maltooligosyltrehalose trehalohydrolase